MRSDVSMRSAILYITLLSFSIKPMSSTSCNVCGLLQFLLLSGLATLALQYLGPFFVGIESLGQMTFSTIYLLTCKVAIRICIKKLFDISQSIDQSKHNFKNEKVLKHKEKMQQRND